MIQTRHLGVVAVLATFLAVALGARAGEHEGTLVLKVDGKDVTLQLAGGTYAVAEGGKADGFAIGGEQVILLGDFDLNGDGKTDGKDKLALDADENVKPASITNKKGLVTPTAENQEIAVTLPKHGRCQVLKGSTLTVTKYKKSATGDHDRWSGTVSLKLKPENGPATLQVQGTFDCGTGAE